MEILKSQNEVEAILDCLVEPHWHAVERITTHHEESRNTHEIIGKLYKWLELYYIGANEISVYVLMLFIKTYLYLTGVAVATDTDASWPKIWQIAEFTSFNAEKMKKVCEKTWLFFRTMLSAITVDLHLLLLPQWSQYNYRVSLQALGNQTICIIIYLISPCM